ncbi:TRL domain-containing protein [Nitrospira sp. M1]
MRKRQFTTMLVMLVGSMLLSGCLYTDIQVPRAYRSASPIDVKAKATDNVVIGESCNRAVLFLVAWGNGGYVGAIKNALANEPTGSILYDVHVDVKATAYVFGLYTQTCTVVTGKVGSV